MKRATLYATIAGALFGAGLVLSGMTLPRKVAGFLDVTGDWDASLAFVMVGAIAVHGVFRLWAARARPAWLSEPAESPADRGATRVNARLVFGAAVFGVGWGIAGYCPGPALVSVTSGVHALVFTAPMLLGLWGSHLWLQRSA